MINRSTTMKDKFITTIKQNSNNPNTLHHNLNRSYVDKQKSNNQQEQGIVYSLKPLKYTIPKDVPVVDIFRLIRRSRYEEEKPYSSLQLSIRDKAMRGEFIEKMKIFILCEKFSYSIVSYSIYYMDLLISKKTELPLEHIFIGSMILTIKYYSVETRVFLLKRVQKFMKDTSKKTYEIDELLEIEIKCLMHLKYKLNLIHTNHFIQMLLLNGVVFNIDIPQNVKVNGSNIYDIIYEIMDSYYETGNYFSFDTFHLSCAIVTLAREICGFTPWSSFLSRVFNIELHQFEYCLNSIRQSYNTNNTNTNECQTSVSPIPKPKEIKAPTTVKKSNQAEEDEFEVKNSVNVKTTDLFRSADKGIKTKSMNFKQYFQETNKEKEDVILQTQRAINNNRRKLNIIKENDINSTEDNSFVSITDNLNRTAILKKESKISDNEKDNNLIISQRSSKNISKREFEHQQEEMSPKSVYKMKLDNVVDDNSKDNSIINEQQEYKKEFRKKGTISFSRQFNHRINSIQDKSYNGDYKRLERKDQLNDIDDSLGYENSHKNKFHLGLKHKK